MSSFKRTTFRSNVPSRWLMHQGFRSIGTMSHVTPRSYVSSGGPCTFTKRPMLSRQSSSSHKTTATSPGLHLKPFMRPHVLPNPPCAGFDTSVPLLDAVPPPCRDTAAAGGCPRVPDPTGPRPGTSARSHALRGGRRCDGCTHPPRAPFRQPWHRTARHATAPRVARAAPARLFCSGWGDRPQQAVRDCAA